MAGLSGHEHNNAGQPHRRALLISSPYSNLGMLDGVSGIDKDVEVMSTLLAQLEFTVSTCVGQHSTCHRIRSALKTFQAEAQPDDCLFIYYTGHGGLVSVDDPSITTPPFDFQFLVPMDYEVSKDAVRAILDVELSHYLNDLTQITKNVTVVLDCCHSSGLARKVATSLQGLERKELDPIILKTTEFTDLRSHINGQFARKEVIGTTFVGGNPHVVRISAAGKHHSAYVEPGNLSVLTRAFSQVVRSLSLLGSPQSWRTIVDSVAEEAARHPLLLEKKATQEIEVAGPYRRLMFDTREHDVLGMVGVELGYKTGAVLLAGELDSVEVGDSYALVHPSWALKTEKRAIFSASVVAVGPVTAALSLTGNGRTLWESEVRAYGLLIHKASRRVVQVQGSEDLCRSTEGLIKNSPFWQTTNLPSREEGSEAPKATLKVKDNRLAILDDQQAEFWYCEAENGDQAWFFESGLRQTMFQLDVYARGMNLRTLSSQVKNQNLETALRIEWGVVRSSEKEEREDGEVIGAGEAVYVQIKRADIEDDDPVYVSIFDIGLAGTITLLTTRVPSGEEIPQYGPYIYGCTDSGELVGEELEFPAGVPKDRARLETFVLIFTNQPWDFSFMDTNIKPEDVAVEAQRRAAPDLKCRVERIDFQLQPVLG